MWLRGLQGYCGGPVLAAPRTSLPVSSAGIVRACTSVMYVKFIALMPFIVGSDRPSVANSVVLMMPETCAC